MRNTDVLVVGGGLAGLTAALTAKRYFRDKKVVLVRKEEKVLLPWGLPYIFAAGTFDKNVMRNTRLFDKKIDLVVDAVTEIDRQGKRVATANSGKITYDKLILATGSLPVESKLKGAHLKGVFTINKDIPCLKSLRRSLNTAKNLVIIGGGFTGVEFSYCVSKEWQLNVTLVERRPHCLAQAFDTEVCLLAEEKLRSRGVNIITGAQVKELLGSGRVEEVKLSNGQILAADLVLMAVGVAPHIELAEKAGLKADARTGIWVDDYMRTSDPDIFAAGDCAEKSCFFGRGPSLTKLASLATSGARIAGTNLFGLRQPQRLAVEVFSTVIGDLALGTVGLTEQAAREAGIEVVTSAAQVRGGHSGSTPGTKELGAKLVFARDTGVITGAQVYGGSSAAVRELTNLLAAAVQHKMRAAELETIQAGEHPTLTSTFRDYQLVNAAV